MLVNYSDQARDNMLCLFEDVEYSERREVFFRIIKHFSEREVGWAVGCSMNLFLRGVVDDFHDLDLIVDIKSVDEVKKTMDELGAKLIATGGNGYCESDIYLHYQLGRVDVDVISGFRVLTFGTSYYYEFAQDEIDVIEVEGISIPLISLEAMYVLYFMMEGWQPRRKFKRLLIEEYFKQNRPIHREVFAKAISENNLPGWIRWEIKKIVSY